MGKTTEMKKLCELNYESFLAAAMRDYLDYLDHLGFSTKNHAYNLKSIDRFLIENGIHLTDQLNTRLMIEFADKHKGRIKANTLRLLQGKDTTGRKSNSAFPRSVLLHVLPSSVCLRTACFRSHCTYNICVLFPSSDSVHRTIEVSQRPSHTDQSKSMLQS